MKTILNAPGILAAATLCSLMIPVSSAWAGGHHFGTAASACCGAGGGVAHLGTYYAEGLISPYQPGFGHQNSGFLSGYEGLPSMDGGGVHQRYPYHSYRRPWFHPGPPSSNVSIVW